MLKSTELVIDGKSLTFALEKDISKLFLELAVMFKAVLCCRCLLVKYLASFHYGPQVAFLRYRRLLSSNLSRRITSQFFSLLATVRMMSV